MSYEVVWDGAHRGEGRDSLLPPRDERTNAIWSSEAWEPDSAIEKTLWQEVHPKETLFKETLEDQRQRIRREYK